MARTYGFDHFQLSTATPRSRSMRREDKQRLSQPRPGLGEAEGEGVHYGKSHAQTEEILKARALAPPRKQPNTVPIGALPATEELPPRGHFQELREEGARQFSLLKSGIGDVGKALLRLASLPVRALRLASHRLRAVHG